MKGIKVTGKFKTNLKKKKTFSKNFSFPVKPSLSLGIHELFLMIISESFSNKYVCQLINPTTLRTVRPA